MGKALCGTAVGLLVLGACGGSGPGIPVVAIAWLIVTPLLIVDLLGLGPKLRLPKWAGRPNLGRWAAIVYVLGVFFPTVPSCASVLTWVGTGLFLWDARRRGELVSVDVAKLVKGWRVVLLIGILLALGSYGSAWDNTYRTSGWSSYHREGRWEYRTWHPGQTFGGKENALSLNLTGWPSLLLLGAAIWGALRRPAYPGWWRFVPAGLAVLLWIWVIPHVKEGQRAVEKFRGSSASVTPAEGPLGFTFGLVVFSIAAAGVAIFGAGKGTPQEMVAPPPCNDNLPG